jgi:hypothetical protein
MILGPSFRGLTIPGPWYCVCQVLDRLLLQLKARGDRVLLFCQSTMMLDVLQVSPRPSPRTRLTGLDWT